jgi:uncharacterized protein YjbI with pentapeptide repeats
VDEKDASLLAEIRKNAKAGASALVFVYVIVAVLQQSDAELILPSSVFDLGGLLDKVKDGVPGGSFVAPILQVKVPLTLFYTVGPVVLLAIHAAAVLDRATLAEASGPIRLLAIWSAPVALALIRWRFAPYVSARPTPPPIGRAMEALQTLALAADAVLVAVALLRGPPNSTVLHGRMRMRAALARAGRHAAVIWLIILLAAGLVPWRQAVGPRDGIIATEWLFAAVLLSAWLADAPSPRRADHALRRRLWYFHIAVMEDLNMLGRAGLLAIFVGLAALPSFARTLDLSGESLVGHAPSDTLIQTLLAERPWAAGWTRDKREDWTADTSLRIQDIRSVAWHADGRGINLANWNFPGGRFDRATMALIRLAGANLEKASLDSANLIGANLSRARLGGASMRSALLDGADLTAMKARGANLDRASLNSATMVGADLGAVRLIGASLRATVLNGSDLTATIARGADFSSASMVGAIVHVAGNEPMAVQPAAPLPAATQPVALLPAVAEASPCDDAKWPRTMRTDFSGAKLSGAHLEKANLTCANLVSVIADEKTTLTGAILTGVDFSGATLSGADLAGAQATFVVMNRSTKLDGTKLKGANFRRAVLHGVVFSEAKDVNDAYFDFADVRCAVFPADFHAAHMNGAIITGARLAPAKDGQSGKSLEAAEMVGVQQLSPTPQDVNVLREDCQ